MVLKRTANISMLRLSYNNNNNEYNTKIVGSIDE